MASMIRDISTPRISSAIAALPKVVIASPSVSSRPRRHWPKPNRLFVVSLISTLMVLSFIGVSGILRARYLAQRGGAAVSPGTIMSTGVEAAPDETPVTPAQRTQYKVAPDAPRILSIGKLGIESRVMALGTLQNGQLATPRNIYDTGWFTGSSKPGQAGATLIAGHMTGLKNYGVFTNLSKLIRGDIISIERGDGKVISYKVVTTIQVPVAGVDMSSLMVPVVAGKPGLNLITCTGSFVTKLNTFSDRLLVYTTQI